MKTECSTILLVPESCLDGRGGSFLVLVCERFVILIGVDFVSDLSRVDLSKTCDEEEISEATFLNFLYLTYFFSV